MARRFAPHLSTLTLLLPLWLSPVSVVFAETEVATPSPHAERVLAAKVNGVPIYADQLEARIRKGIRKFNRRSNPDAEVPDVVRKGLQTQALQEQIAAELLYQAALKHEFPGIEKRIAEKVAKRKEELIANQQPFDEAILRASGKRHVYVNEYMALKDLINPQPPEEEIRAYYEKTKEGYASQADAVHVRHILIKADEKASAEKHEQAKELIEQVRQQLLAGADFARMADEYSEDANAAGGGDLGFIKPGYMPPSFEKVAFSLKQGQLSEPVKTPFGYHVLEVLGFKPKGSLPEYEELRDFFAKYLSKELLKKKIPEHIQELKAKADIEIFLSQNDDSEEAQSSVVDSSAHKK